MVDTSHTAHQTPPLPWTSAPLHCIYHHQTLAVTSQTHHGNDVVSGRTVAVAV